MICYDSKALTALPAADTGSTEQAWTLHYWACGTKDAEMGQQPKAGSTGRLDGAGGSYRPSRIDNWGRSW